VAIQRDTNVRIDCDIDQAETVFLVLRDRDLVVAAFSAGRLGLSVDENSASAGWPSSVLEVLLGDGVDLPGSQALVDFAKEVRSKVGIVVGRCRPVEDDAAYDAVSVLR
jgi:hypothetical protein